MLKNMNAQMNIRSILENSEFTLYLTGSRYFGNSGDFSDWDFFMQDDGTQYGDYSHIVESICDTFTNAGVACVGDDTGNAYDDQEILSVLKFTSHVGSFDIQIVRNAERRQRMHEEIKDWFNTFTGYIKKNERRKEISRQVWHMLWKAYHLGVIDSQ